MFRYRMVTVALISFCCHSCIPESRNAAIPIHLIDSVALSKAGDVKDACTAVFTDHGVDCLMLSGINYGEGIYFFALSGDKKGQRIVLPRFDSLLQGISNQDVTFLSADSIFQYIRMDNGGPYDLLRLIDTAGQVKKTWKINTVFNGDSLILYPANIQGGNDYYLPSGNLYFKRRDIRRPFKVEQSARYNKFLAIQLSGDSGFIAHASGASPPGYAHFYYGSPTSWPSMAVRGDKMIVSHFLSDTLYLYEGGGAETTAIDGHSDHVHPSNDLFDLSREDDRAYRAEFATTHAYYHELVVRKESPYIFRKAFHQYHYYNDDSTANHAPDAPWSVVVLDSNFRIRGEIGFPARRYSISSFTPAGNGFWIADLENPLKYYHYEMDIK